MNQTDQAKLVKIIDSAIRAEVKGVEKRLKGESASSQHKELHKLADSVLKSLNSGKQVDIKNIKSAYRKFDDDPTNYAVVKRLAEQLCTLFATMKRPEKKPKPEITA